MFPFYVFCKLVGEVYGHTVYTHIVKRLHHFFVFDTPSAYVEAIAAEPLYPFGFGLSYTTFEIGAPKAKRTTYRAGEQISVSVMVKNCGSVAGKEVVQLYASKPESAVMRAPRELKAFQKVSLEAGESKRVELRFDADDLSYWDEASHAWQLEKGNYTLYVGNSSEATESVQIQLK